MLFVYVCLECFAVLKFENNVITKVKFENTEALAENRIVDLCRLGMIKKPWLRVICLCGLSMICYFY